jgi:hypothetical protein
MKGSYYENSQYPDRWLITIRRRRQMNNELEQLQTELANAESIAANFEWVAPFPDASLMQRVEDGFAANIKLIKDKILEL